MINLKLHRFETTDEGTFGVLIHNHKPFAVTLERQWLDNKKGISCIPEGEYICKRCRTSPEYGYKDSPKFGDTFQITNVPGRSKILFHKGNIDDDSHGCVLIGEQFGELGLSAAILSSKQGFNEFNLLLHGYDTFKISIINKW